MHLKKMAIKKFDLTGKCNLRCEACFNLDFMKVLKDIPVQNVLSNTQPRDVVYLGGGEPLLHHGLGELTESLLKLPSDVVISTNATMYRGLPKDAQIQASFWAMDPCLYNRITGGNNFRVAKENIEKFISGGHPVFLNMPVYENNFNEIGAVSDYAHGLKIPLRIVPIYPANGFFVSEELKRRIEGDAWNLMLKGRNVIYSPKKYPVRRWFKT